MTIEKLNVGEKQDAHRKKVNAAIDALETGKQDADATLTSLAALGTAADRMAYTTGVDTWAEATITAAGRALLDDADAAAQRTTLGVAEVIDEDDMSSDSATRPPSQQSVKAYVDASGPSVYTSGELTVSTNITASHGLGSVPDIVQVWFVCKTSNAGYSVGDRILMSAHAYAPGSDISTTYATSSTVGFRALNGSWDVSNKSTGAVTTITNTRWRAVFKAVLF